MLLKIKNKLSQIISSEEISIDDIEVDVLYDDKGDFTSNIALKFAKIFKKILENLQRK